MSSTYFKKCEMCGKSFETKAHNAIFCKDCRSEITKTQRKEFAERKEGKRGYTNLTRKKNKEVSFKEGLHRNIDGSEKNRNISDISRRAREAGMSYGQYIACAHREGKRHEAI